MIDLSYKSGEVSNVANSFDIIPREKVAEVKQEEIKVEKKEEKVKEKENDFLSIFTEAVSEESENDKKHSKKK